ncbi:MAG: hypothetical protein NNA30_12155 [Nitrospira sp.]|nr:hypothetical protein [Nitrospira sp.]
MTEPLQPTPHPCGPCHRTPPADTPERHPLRQNVSPLVVPRRAYTPSRPSCIECVEKHLGAAYVLLTEAREGYAYRLRAVGHLFEAEDESQEWPELHAAIRNARTRYQASGEIPEWHLLDDLLRKMQK